MQGLSSALSRCSSRGYPAADAANVNPLLSNLGLNGDHPVILPAAEALGADMARVVMAVAWGDGWTNLLQPFWALPMLGVAGLKAKDIMGFCLIHLFITGAIIGTLLVVL